MKFTNNEENHIILKTDHGLVLTFDFDQEAVDIDGECDIRFNNDTPEGIFFSINGDMRMLGAIIKAAAVHYEIIMAESAKEGAIEAAHRAQSMGVYNGGVL